MKNSLFVTNIFLFTRLCMLIIAWCLYLLQYFLAIFQRRLERQCSSLVQISMVSVWANITTLWKYLVRAESIGFYPCLPGMKTHVYICYQEWIFFFVYKYVSCPSAFWNILSATLTSFNEPPKHTDFIIFVS